MKRDAIIVPLKRFGIAKDRLRSAGSHGVTALVEALAIGVLRSAAPRDVFVVCESDDIALFAERHHVGVGRSGATSLNEAVQGAYEGLSEHYDQLIVVHGDLSQPAGLGQFEPSPGVTIVSDHHRRGTNVLVVPAGLSFHFAYGPNSAERHQREARRLDVSWRVIHDSPWGFDVDEPEDLPTALNVVWGGPAAPPNSTPRRD